ncbi:MAG: MoxR family ATPase [Candidatus Marsarchaeota archaeon]|jgi:MoxR-like ATPase|nr:MoxR family ATPase [Candidatus Marsarchaeota archaeon]
MDAKSLYANVTKELEKHISGNQDILKLMFISLVADGHALLEGVPGVAKTTMTKALAAAIDSDFKRVQCTADLEIGDIIGSTYLDEQRNVKLKKGPVFTNILLADELNRAPVRTMSGFLEVLEERRVTIGGEDMPLPKPFIAFATQNPLTIEGTIPIPKVLADRFLMRINVGYPTEQAEEAMIRIKEREEHIEFSKVISKEDILELQKQAKTVKIPDEVVAFITKVVEATRTDIHVVMGGSPRADLSFMAAGKAKALIDGRTEVTKEDILYLARPVLSHRLVVRSTGGIGVNGVIDGIVATLS